MVEKQESAQATEEQESTPTEATLKESESASESDSETSGESAEGKAESEETEKGEESKEESYENKVTSLAQKIADKSTRTITKQRDDLIGQVAKLVEELNDKIFTSENEKVFKDEVESVGEDDARKRKEHRDHTNEVSKNIRQREIKVNETLAKLGDSNLDEILKKLKVPNLTEGIAMLSYNVLNNKIKEELWGLLFSEDKDKLTQYTKHLKKFDKVQDTEDVELVMGGIRDTIKAKSEPFVPDSPKGSGGGGSDAQFKKQFAAGDLPVTKDNIDRYNKLLEAS